MVARASRRSSTKALITFRNLFPIAATGHPAMPFDDGTAEVIVFDPPHLPAAAGSSESDEQMKRDYGLASAPRGNDITSVFQPFLREASRVLAPDGVIFAKVKDYVHNHAYRWCMVAFIEAAKSVDGLTPCDLVVKVDPCGGNLKSSKWESAHHLRNQHCYWIVVRKGRCERKKVAASSRKGTRRSKNSR